MFKRSNQLQNEFYPGLKWYFKADFIKAFEREQLNFSYSFLEVAVTMKPIEKCQNLQFPKCSLEADCKEKQPIFFRQKNVSLDLFIDFITHFVYKLLINDNSDYDMG